jgi:hypothetical protein
MNEEQMGAFIRRLSDEGTDLTVMDEGTDLTVMDNLNVALTQFTADTGIVFAIGATLWAALEALAAKMEAQ